MSLSILSAGGHIPRLRLPRRIVAEANGWINPRQNVCSIFILGRSRG